MPLGDGRTQVLSGDAAGPGSEGPAKPSFQIGVGHLSPR